MAEELRIDLSVSKKDRYEQLYPQLEALISSEEDNIANMANLSAALKETFDFLWVGFYIIKDNELVLGPFQGPIACTRISIGKGVCGKAFEKGEPIIVDDVDKFPGHISCSSESKSEIVIPFRYNNLQGVLDVDSSELAAFDEIDEVYLRRIVKILEV